jgi:positive regulator of sigma E activity
VVERDGRVTEIRAGAARVTFAQTQGCLNCQRGHGCGLGPILSLFGQGRSADPWVDSGANDLTVGDSVCVSVSGARLVRYSVLAYFVPTFTLLTGAVFLSAMLPGRGDWPAVAGASAGLLVGWLSLAVVQSRPDRLPGCVVLRPAADES